MKKKLSYRDKLVELAYIYDVKEITDYEIYWEISYSNSQLGSSS